MRIAVALLIVFAAGASSARDESGRLATIIAPNNAQPAIVTPGATFRAFLRANVPLRIESSAGEADLELVSAAPWRGHWMVELRVPNETPAGAYTLVSDGTGTRDVVHRAVYVLADRPETYTVAQLNNLRVGDLRGSDSGLYRVTAALNAGAPDLILVTGELSASGTADQLRVALDILNDCAAPTFVAPGAPDDRLGLAETYLGTYPVSLWFGLDGFLLCPPAPAITPGVETKLHIERRAIRAARWSTGVAAQFPHDDLRAAFTLLADDPLDYVFDEAPNIALDPRPGWGKTEHFSIGPGRAQVRWFRVGPRGIEPLDPESE